MMMVCDGRSLTLLPLRKRSKLSLGSFAADEVLTAGRSVIPVTGQDVDSILNDEDADKDVRGRACVLHLVSSSNQFESRVIQLGC